MREIWDTCLITRGGCSKGASLRGADLKTRYPSHCAGFGATILDMRLIVARRLVHMPYTMEGHLHCSVYGKATVVPAGISGFPQYYDRPKTEDQKRMYR